MALKNNQEVEVCWRPGTVSHAASANLFTPTEASHHSRGPWLILILLLSFLWLVQNLIILYTQPGQRKTHIESSFGNLAPPLAYWATARILCKLQFWSLRSLSTSWGPKPNHINCTQQEMRKNIQSLAKLPTTICFSLEFDSEKQMPQIVGLLGGHLLPNPRSRLSGGLGLPQKSKSTGSQLHGLG